MVSPANKHHPTIMGFGNVSSVSTPAPLSSAGMPSSGKQFAYRDSTAVFSNYLTCCDEVALDSMLGDAFASDATYRQPVILDSSNQAWYAQYVGS
jgi:hypothetical protein